MGLPSQCWREIPVCPPSSNAGEEVVEEEAARQSASRGHARRQRMSNMVVVFDLSFAMVQLQIDRCDWGCGGVWGHIRVESLLDALFACVTRYWGTGVHRVSCATNDRSSTSVKLFEIRVV